ncbi:hypothetical protein BJ875DRAFT_285333 [Amylocarpus encephaloides]|uniref:Potassium channel domain-containing protein n=1 Tax=Amylocarpus encephaloides TaxID=45428 RepID=A0A9P7YRX6_9HELO|nr:hypothetical protein BJ875DRAFT_285333 [Amylocarpus encephaloides]
MADVKDLTPPNSSSESSTSNQLDLERTKTTPPATGDDDEAPEESNRSTNTLEDIDPTRTIRTRGMLPTLRLRGKTDDLPQNWWFASTAIPLLAATIGPLANVLSIAALVSTWRVTLPNNGVLPEGADAFGVDIPDPRWEVILNAFSLGLGFFGNFLLLLNFTKRVRYIIALPFTIIAWYFATGILIGIVVAMNKFVPPVRPGETYSQGFWYAIIAAILYMIGSMILMVNMLGYFLGHYPQHFDLDDDQRTLILQTMMFFFWLAGGAAVFQKVCGWSYADALYFCDVTVLTVGFGDFVGTNDTARGLVFPYSVGGIIFLGLMINSIRKFAVGMSKDKIVRKHQLRQREQTFGRTVTSEKELRERLGLPPRRDTTELRRASNAEQGTTDALKRRSSLDQYGHLEVRGRTIKFHQKKTHSAGYAGGGGRGGAGRENTKRTTTALSRDAKLRQHAAGHSAEAKRTARRSKLLLLKEEKDRFEAMREIQANTHKFEKYWALAMSVLAFGALWCVGAVAFMYAEHRMQGLSYFQSLYFCYVSLLTIGYGDFSPKSNAGKPLFVIWSLIAVPTMTILISDMSDTVVGSINRGTFKLADWTIMPKEGVWHDFLESHPKLKEWLERKTKEREAKQRIQAGFELQRPDEDILTGPSKTLETLAEEKPPTKTDHELARLLAKAIKRVANDLTADPPKQYSYEEWVDFTRLIRFSAESVGKFIEEDGEVEEFGELGVMKWDWIGEDSPMLAEEGESEWVLERLCESLDRYTRLQSRKSKRRFSIGPGPPSARGSFDGKHTHEAVHPSLHNHPAYPAHPGHRAHHLHDHHGSPGQTNPVLRHGEDGDEILPLRRDSAAFGGDGDDGDGEGKRKREVNPCDGMKAAMDEGVKKELGDRLSGEEAGDWMRGV